MLSAGWPVSSTLGWGPVGRDLGRRRILRLALLEGVLPVIAPRKARYAYYDAEKERGGEAPHKGHDGRRAARDEEHACHLARRHPVGERHHAPPAVTHPFEPEP